MYIGIVHAAMYDIAAAIDGGDRPYANALTAPANTQSAAAIAAAAHGVLAARQAPVYENPAEFFALTYPTHNLRGLVRDVALRVAGKNDKAVRHLQLTYGGGKTHTLIALRHLVQEPDALPDLPAVQDFVQEIGQRPAKACVVALCFDKLDVEKGMEVVGPGGTTRVLKQPWSVLAYQLAGDAGLKVLHAEGLYSAPLCDSRSSTELMRNLVGHGVRTYLECPADVRRALQDFARQPPVAGRPQR